MKVIVLIAALLLGAMTISTANAASAGKPFLRGVFSSADLANRIEVSLIKNPRGTSIIDPDRCKEDGSCASPQNYLLMFQISDPQAHLTDVAQVPNLLRALRVAEAPSGEYWLACLKPMGDGTYKSVLHCVSRSFKPGEKVWTDPKTGRIVLASDCTNPVEKPVPSKACVEINFETKPGDTVVRFALLGPQDVSDDCVGVKRSGEIEFDAMHWWVDECATRYCDFSADASVVGQPVRLMGSYVPQPGKHVLRLSAIVSRKSSQYVTVLCLERSTMTFPQLPDGKVSLAQITEYSKNRQEWIISHSDGMGVRWRDYLLDDSGAKKSARVYYTKAEIPKGKPQLYIPWGEWKNPE